MINNPNNISELKRNIGNYPIVIYGKGFVGNIVADFCIKNQIDYLFTESGIERDDISKKEILPNKLNNELINSYVVIASINFYNEIYTTLTKTIGINEERIMSYLFFWPHKYDWNELENTVDWERVKQRAQIFAAWIDPSSKSVTDYSFERNFLKEFIPKDMVYISPEYFSIIDNVPVAGFRDSEKYQKTDASSCLAMLMSFRNPDDVIDHICEYTDKLIVASYVPLENMSDIRFRRSINYYNDFTEGQFLDKFSKHGFIVQRKETDPFDSVHIVYKFVKQS